MNPQFSLIPRLTKSVEIIEHIYLVHLAEVDVDEDRNRAYELQQAEELDGYFGFVNGVQSNRFRHRSMMVASKS